MNKTTNMLLLIEAIKNTTSLAEIKKAFSKISEIDFDVYELNLLLPVIYGLQKHFSSDVIKRDEIISEINSVYFKMSSKIGCN